MKLIYLGKDIDTTKEHEFLSNNKFGYKVIIEYTEECFYPEKRDILYNYTEVHHLWSLDYMGGPSIAFESDILKTGFTRRINDIKSVVVELCNKKYGDEDEI